MRESHFNSRNTCVLISLSLFLCITSYLSLNTLILSILQPDRPDESYFQHRSSRQLLLVPAARQDGAGKSPCKYLSLHRRKHRAVSSLLFLRLSAQRHSMTELLRVFRRQLALGVDEPDSPASS